MATIVDRMRKLREQATNALRHCVKAIVCAVESVVEIAQKVITYLGKKVDQFKAALSDVKASEQAADDGVDALHTAHVIGAVGVKEAARKLVDKCIPHDFLASLGLHIKTWTLKICALAKAHHLTCVANLCAPWCSTTPLALGISVASWGLTAALVAAIYYFRKRKRSKLAQETSELHKKIKDLTEKLNDLKDLIAGLGQPFAAAA
jgi:hypothetical protein